MAEPSLVAQNPLVQEKIKIPSPTRGFATFGAQQGVQNVATQEVATQDLATQTVARDQAAGRLAAEQATLQLRQQQLQALRTQVTEETSNIQRLNGEKSSLQGQISAAQQQLQAAQARLAQIQAENERRRQATLAAQKAQQQPVTQASAPITPQGPQKDWNQDPEYRDLYNYFISDYTPRTWRAEEEALREINRQIIARGNRPNDTTGIDTDAIRRSVGARFGDPEMTTGKTSSDDRIRRFWELFRQAGGATPDVGYNQAPALEEYGRWKANSGGDWRDWYNKPKPPSVGVGSF